MQNWKDLLQKECSNTGFNKSEFLNKYEHLIDGPNRSAKRKRVTRYLELLQRNNSVTPVNKETFLQENNIFEANSVDLDIEPNKQITFGLISDTHFNSKYVQLTYLNDFYDICASQGITDVYHVGDVDEGEMMRPGHAYENYRQGADDHISEIVKNYPYREGITTHFITGNHDASFRKSCGLDIGKQIATKRPDMNYLGRDVANINITNKITMQLRYPWSGSAYALSYRPQKIVESMEAACLDKPDILCIGHYHKIEYLFYHGVHVFQTGCFQSATPFTTGKGISVSMGGWIVTVETDSEGNLKAITPKVVVYNRAIKEDYKNW